MTLTTLKGKVVLSSAQELVIQNWCKVLHAEWNACTAAFKKASIVEQQKRWRDKALTCLLSDRKGKEKSKLKAQIISCLEEENYPLHEWVWAPLPKCGEDGKVTNVFHLACRLEKARGVKAIHEPRSKGTLQNPLVEFYRYEHNFLTPYVNPLPPTPDEAKPKYDKIAAQIRRTHSLGDQLNTRYENGLVKRFKASVQLFFKNTERHKPPRFKRRSQPLQWLFTFQADQCSYNVDGISLPGKKRLGLLIDQNGNLRKRLAGYVEPDIRSAALSREHDGWYLSLTIRYEAQTVTPLKGDPRTVGIDMGVVHHCITSEGHIFGSREKTPKRILFLADKIERLQIKASGQILRSKSWEKTQQQIRKLRAQLARNRKAWAEKLTTRLLSRYDLIFIEDLNHSAMRRKAKAQLNEKGQWKQNRAKAKTGLNRSLANAAPGATLAMLERKVKELPNKQVIRVDPKHTSQTCHVCGVVDKASRQSQELFVCTSCGHRANADINAAKNILRRGLQSYQTVEDMKETE